MSRNQAQLKAAIQKSLRNPGLGYLRLVQVMHGKKRIGWISLGLEKMSENAWLNQIRLGQVQTN